MLMKKTLRRRTVLIALFLVLLAAATMLEYGGFKRAGLVGVMSAPRDRHSGDEAGLTTQITRCREGICAARRLIRHGNGWFVVPAAEAAGNGVAMIDDQFSPANLTIMVGDTVTWTNTGMASHTTASDAGSAETWDSGNMAPGGQPFAHTFMTAGIFPYHCAYHGSFGMTGTITVQDATTPTATAAPPSPTLAPPTATPTPATTPTVMPASPIPVSPTVPAPAPSVAPSMTPTPMTVPASLAVSATAVSSPTPLIALTATPTGVVPVALASPTPTASPALFTVNTAVPTLAPTITPITVVPTMMDTTSLPTATPPVLPVAASPTALAAVDIHNAPRTVQGGRDTLCDLQVNLIQLAKGCEIVSSISAPGARVRYTLTYPQPSAQQQVFTDTADTRSHSLHIFNVPYQPPVGAKHGTPPTVIQVDIMATLPNGSALRPNHTRFVVIR